jgi:hypothetical protein
MIQKRLRNMTLRAQRKWESESMKAIVVAMLCLPILTACNRTTGGAEIAVKGACTVWQPLDYSKKDTAQTRTGIQQNNARRDGFCQ